MKMLLLVVCMWSVSAVAQEQANWGLTDVELNINCQNGKKVNFEADSMFIVNSVKQVSNTITVNYLAGEDDVTLRYKLVLVGKKKYMAVPLDSDVESYFFISYKEANQVTLYYSDKKQEICDGGLVNFVLDVEPAA